MNGIVPDASEFQDKILCHHCGAIPCPADHAEQKKERLVDLNVVKEMSQRKTTAREKSPRGMSHNSIDEHYVMVRLQVFDQDTCVY